MSVALQSYFYQLIARYIRLFVRPQDTLKLYSPAEEPLRRMFFGQPEADEPDYVVVSGEVHFQSDIQAFLGGLHKE